MNWLNALKRALLSRLERRIDRRVDERLAAFVTTMTQDLLQKAAVTSSSLARTTATQTPNLEALAFALRDLRTMRWNIKVLGSALAHQLHAAGYLAATTPPAPVHVALTSKLCCQADMQQPWLRYWAHQLKMAPILHRKVWEDTFVLQALWEAGMLQSGRRGLGFAVGAEGLPAYFTSHGVEVLATDLESTDARSRAWQGSGQHAATLDHLYRPDLVTRERFDALCQYRACDMNAIPDELGGRFDFCWSVCSLEHVGSIARGLQFVENSLQCLKPGGIAVHTTEFNLENGEETIDHWGTVLFQRRHIDALCQRLAASGNEVAAVDYDVGTGALDGFIDLPPYPHELPWALPGGSSPHLRLSIDGFAATSIGLIIRAASA